MLNNSAIAVVGRAWLSMGKEERSLTNKVGSTSGDAPTDSLSPTGFNISFQNLVSYHFLNAQIKSAPLHTINIHQLSLINLRL